MELHDMLPLTLKLTFHFYFKPYLWLCFMTSCGLLEIGFTKNIMEANDSAKAFSFASGNTSSRQNTNKILKDIKGPDCF
jgi:hypothetical protein